MPGPARSFVLGLVAFVCLGCVSIPGDASPSPDPIVQSTSTPPASPSASPGPPPTSDPTHTQPPPTSEPTAAPRPTSNPTDEPPSPTATGGRLDFSADPNYGLIELTSGFVPDPTTREMLSGGSVDASYLGGECRGFATSAPDLSVRYTVQGLSSLLRFYFEGNGDTTLIVNDPSGNWLCSNDSFGTLSPTIDIDNPATGRYDIWVGSYASGATMPGTLSITELDSNRP